MKAIIINAIILMLILVSVIIVVNSFNNNFNFNNINNFAVVLDTGKADCIVIKDDDTIIVIDTAEQEDFHKLQDFLDTQGIKNIDYLIITHFDKDHVGGAADLIKNYNILNIIEADYLKESIYVDNYRDAISDNNIDVLVLKEDLKINLGNMILTLNPSSVTNSNSNDSSIIVILDLLFTNQKVLFMGDAEKERIDEFLNNNSLNNNNNYDFIKWPHHGNYNSKLEDLIKYTNPLAVGITCSNKNPADDKTLELLNKYNIDTYLTSDGNIDIIDIINKYNKIGRAHV